MLISSNLVFSQWDRIFQDPMTTAAAIDRLVHHALILEMTGPSFRTEQAKTQQQEATRAERDIQNSHPSTEGVIEVGGPNDVKE